MNQRLILAALLVSVFLAWLSVRFAGEHVSPTRREAIRSESSVVECDLGTPARLGSDGSKAQGLRSRSIGASTPPEALSDHARLLGVVRSRASGALPGATVTAYTPSMQDENTGEARLPRVAAAWRSETTSGADGGFSIASDITGLVAVDLAHPGHANLTVHTYLTSAREVKDLGEIELQPVSLVRISVHDEYGAPVDSARIQIAHGLARISGSENDRGFRDAGVSDPTGQLECDSLEYGRNRVLVTAEDFLPWTGDLQVDAAGEVTLAVILESGLFIEGSVSSPNFELTTEARVTSDAIAPLNIKRPLPPGAMDSTLDGRARFRLGPFPTSMATNELRLSLQGPGGYYEQLESEVVSKPGESGLVLDVVEAAYVTVQTSCDSSKIQHEVSTATLSMFGPGGRLGYAADIDFDTSVEQPCEVLVRVPTGLDVEMRLELLFENGTGFYSPPFRAVAGQRIHFDAKIPLSGGKFELLALSEDGSAPVEGAAVYLYPKTLGADRFESANRDSRPKGGGAFRQPVSVGHTDRAGRVELVGIGQVTMEALVIAPGFVPAVMPAETDTPNITEVRLRRGSTLCVRILDGVKPVEHCALKPIGIPPTYPQVELKRCRQQLVSKSPVPGGFVLYRALPAGTYRFRLHGGPSAREISIEVNGTDDYYEEIVF